MRSAEPAAAPATASDEAETESRRRGNQARANDPVPVSIAGTRIPRAVVLAVMGRMRAGPFRTSELVPIAREGLAKAGGARTVANQVAERLVQRESRSGRVRRVGVDERRVVTWEWAAGEPPLRGDGTGPA